MTFKGRLISDIKSTSDGTNTYAISTDSIIKFESMVSGIVVEFKGFITEMSDKFQSSWDSEAVYGRMDPIGTFKNTQRSISLGWTIPAASIEEAKSNFTAIKSLTSMLYPGYSANTTNLDGGWDFVTSNSLSKPPLIRIEYANLIKSAKGEGLLGWVDGFDINPTLDMGFFIENKNQFPKVYTMSCNFNVLHEHDLGFKAGRDGVATWIAGDPNVKKFPFGEN